MNGPGIMYLDVRDIKSTLPSIDVKLVRAATCREAGITRFTDRCYRVAYL